MIDNKPSRSSPCVSICEMDENNICQGCFRNDEEIREWNTYTDQKRQEILNNAALRFRASNKNVFD